MPSTITSRQLDAAPVLRLLAKRSFCTLATADRSGRPHNTGVLYALVADRLYVNTRRGSRKARNIAANPAVSVCIPIRRAPVGPPSLVQFQSRAELCELSDPEIERLVASGELRALTSHGELELEGSCFVRISLPGRLTTYGLGMPLRQLIRNPLDGAGYVEREPSTDD